MIPLAHGLSGRADLPIPAWLFGWAAAAVLVVSFVLLAVLWRTPRFERYEWKPLPGWISRLVTARATEVLCGALGVFLLGLVVAAGFAGIQSPADNLAPTFVYVTFWCGLVLVSVLFGNVFRAFNPWIAIGRSAGWLLHRIAGERVDGALPYPARLGRWPAAAGLLAFVWLELIAPGGAEPRTLAAAALVYSCLTLLGMALYGVEPWSRRGEAFSVYFELFSRIAIFERRDDEIGRRPLLGGLAHLAPATGTVALLAVMIGSITFDGGQETAFWGEVGPSISDFYASLGAGPTLADELASGTGLAIAILLVAGFYLLGCAGATTVGGGYSLLRLANAFVHSLVPIALVYVAAHYFTFLLFQGQAMWYLVSDPLGKGWDLFGTRDASIDYGLIGATTTWYIQVVFVVLGHAAALALAHDRALVLYEDPRIAVPLAAVDARDHGRVHEPRALAPLAGERVSGPLGHAGHWLGAAAAVVPIVAVAVWILTATLRDRRRGRGRGRQ